MNNEKKRGKLKIYLGYAPGVGKTYAMLQDANELLRNGENVVIGYLETHGRAETMEQIANLHIVPRKKVEYKGRILEEMDTEGIIMISPSIVLIDELAHTNVPGSINKKRYQDVEEILNSGIDVISTLNIQHLESLNFVVENITGVKIRETIPDSIVNKADEVLLVDLTPDALINRLARGKIYKREIITRALDNFFRKGNLTALREIALVETAMGASKIVQEIDKNNNILKRREDEIIAVSVSTNPLSDNLIRRGLRIANAYNCKWVVIYVDCTHRLARQLTKKDIDIINEHKDLAISLGAEYVELKGKSVSRELSKYFKENKVTQVIIGKSKRTKIETLLRGSTINKLLKHTRNIEYHIIPYLK